MDRTREQMAARELHDGSYVNVGIGLPALMPSLRPQGTDSVLRTGNGFLVLGLNPYDVDPDLVSADNGTVATLVAASLFDSEPTAGRIRDGKIGTAILGAMQVAQTGDIDGPMDSSTTPRASSS